MTYCQWTVKPVGASTATGVCGAQTNLMRVKGKGRYVGRERESMVCRNHLEAALKKWTGWEEVEALAEPKA